MCFFGCISLARVFILRVAEFSLSSYRSSKYFLAVDFIILRESFSINFCLCFLLPQGRRQPNPQDICFTCGWPGHWSKTCNVPPYKYKQPSQLKPSPRPTGQHWAWFNEFLWILVQTAWNFMELQGHTFHWIAWHSMELHRYSMKLGGTSWHSMELDQYFMELHGTSWHSMELHPYSMELRGYSMELHVSSMDFHGIP